MANQEVEKLMKVYVPELRRLLEGTGKIESTQRNAELWGVLVGMEAVLAASPVVGVTPEAISRVARGIALDYLTGRIIYSEEPLINLIVNRIDRLIRHVEPLPQPAQPAAEAISEHEIELTLLRSRLRTIHLAGTHGMSNREVADRVAELENVSDQARQYIQNAQQREHRIDELEAALAAVAPSKLPAELRELSEKATRRKWVRSSHCFQIVAVGPVDEEESSSVTELNCPRGLDKYPTAERIEQHKADVEFMVACVNYVRSLLAAIDAPGGKK